MLYCHGLTAFSRYRTTANCALPPVPAGTPAAAAHHLTTHCTANPLARHEPGFSSVTLNWFRTHLPVRAAVLGYCVLLQPPPFHLTVNCPVRRALPRPLLLRVAILHGSAPRACNGWFASSICRLAAARWPWFARFLLPERAFSLYELHTPTRAAVLTPRCLTFALIAHFAAHAARTLPVCNDIPLVLATCGRCCSAHLCGLLLPTHLVPARTSFPGERCLPLPAPGCWFPDSVILRSYLIATPPPDGF